MMARMAGMASNYTSLHQESETAQIEPPYFRSLSYLLPPPSSFSTLLVPK